MIEKIIASIEKGFETNLTTLQISPEISLTLLALGSSKNTSKAEGEILIYQDLFETNLDFYKSLICSKLGLNNKLYARQCKVIVLSKEDFNDFCSKFHYLNFSNCKVRLGLMHNDELVMAAGFSKPRLMYRDNVKYQSAMLIRSSTLYQTTVIGGLSKLLSHFIETEKPDDITTFIDTDYFDGTSFKQLGFEEYKSLESHITWLHIESKQRYTSDQLIKKLKIDQSQLDTIGFIPKGYAPIYNHGTLKLVKVI